MVRVARLWCRKSPLRVSSRLGFAMRRLEHSLCQPSRKWVSFFNKGRIRQRKERDGLRLSSAVHKIQWDSNPTAPMTIRLWETFTFTFYNLIYGYSSSLAYPITLQGLWGTADDFATALFHLILSSAVLVELAKSIPVHSLILSSHHFFCLPLLLFPYIVSCRIVFAKLKTLRNGQTILVFGSIFIG